MGGEAGAGGNILVEGEPKRVVSVELKSQGRQGRSWCSADATSTDVAKAAKDSKGDKRKPDDRRRQEDHVQSYALRGPGVQADALAAVRPGWGRGVWEKLPRRRQQEFEMARRGEATPRKRRRRRRSDSSSEEATKEFLALPAAT